MSSVNWAFLARWNQPMSRMDFMLNNLVLFWSWIVLFSITSIAVSKNLDALAMLLGFPICFFILYNFVISIIWMNNRLRDGGMSKQFWRLVVIFISILSVVAGIVALIYCCAKPTEDPAIFADEEDNFGDQ